MALTAALAAFAAPIGRAAPVLGHPPAAPRSERPESRLFGAWSLLCLTSQTDSCTLSQVVARDREGRQVVLGVSVQVPAGAARPRIDFRMSPQALFAAGLGLKAANGQEYRLKMSECDERTCLASGWLDPGLRKALEEGPAAQVAFLMPEKKQVLVPLALAGFKDGTRELERLVSARRRVGGSQKNSADTAPR